jgi:hypothetical protein
MDLANLNGMARILERLPLHTIFIEFLERPEFKTSVVHAAIVQNAEAIRLWTIRCRLISNEFN